MLIQTANEPIDEMSTFKARAFRKPDDRQFLVDIIKDIKDGTFAGEVEKVRSQKKGSQAHKDAKKALGSFTVSGVFRNRREVSRTLIPGSSRRTSTGKIIPTSHRQT
jgi:hypothetical protein